MKYLASKYTEKSTSQSNQFRAKSDEEGNITITYKIGEEKSVISLTISYIDDILKKGSANPLYTLNKLAKNLWSDSNYEWIYATKDEKLRQKRLDIYENDILYGKLSCANTFNYEHLASCISKIYELTTGERIVDKYGYGCIRSIN